MEKERELLLFRLMDEKANGGDLSQLCYQGYLCLYKMYVTSTDVYNVLARSGTVELDTTESKQANVSETIICQKLMQRHRSKALSSPLVFSCMYYYPSSTVYVLL